LVSLERFGLQGSHGSYVNQLLQRRVAQDYGVQKWESIPFNQDGTVGRPIKKSKRKQDEVRTLALGPRLTLGSDTKDQAQKYPESSIKGSPTSSMFLSGSVGFCSPLTVVSRSYKIKTHIKGNFASKLKHHAELSCWNIGRGRCSTCTRPLPHG